MGRIVYIKVRDSGQNAHQFVNIEGRRIGEIWREQVDIVGGKSHPFKKWRWFAKAAGSLSELCTNSESPNVGTPYGTKDKAVDFLEAVDRSAG